MAADAPSPATPPPWAWWQRGVIYQIYPRSFQDSDGDGVGDLAGILRRLDYLESLAIDCVWLSPIFPSPMRDFGYDVTDYTGVDPLFGTLEDFDRLLKALHDRGIKLVLDFVPNHTSDQHPWFQESRSSRYNPKRHWYLWRDPGPDGGPPNNWLSFFGGPAWSYDPGTGQYYLHQFAREQPELNYRNPEVLEAMRHCLRFWLERGVDGFRVDVIWLLIKDDQFRDEPVDPHWDGYHPHGRLKHIYTANRPEVHAIVRAFRALLDEYGERVLIGETNVPNDQLVQYYGAKLDECQLPFNFQLAYTEWQAPAVRALVHRYYAALPPGAWPNWLLGSHDLPRLATRLGSAQARVATLLLLTLWGTPTWYYGDELGLTNVPIPPEQVRDPQALNQPHLADRLGRDPQRTPLPWDGSANGGFAPPGATPWLPLGADYRERNVAAESADPRSMLSLFRALTRLRRATPALQVGAYAAVESGAEEVFAYSRELDEERYLIVLNFGGRGYRLDLRSVGAGARILLSTGLERCGRVPLGSLELAPHEGLVLYVEAPRWSATTERHRPRTLP